MFKKVIFRKTINIKLLIIGGGRWAKIYLKEILQNFDLDEIYFITNNKEIQEKSNTTKIHILKKNSKIKINNFKKIIICNKTSQHLKYTKNANKQNSFLIEKPLTNNPIDYYNKKILSKAYIALQFSFAEYFVKLKEKLQKKKIKSIQLNWLDSPFADKKYNDKIYFIEDTYYHFYSIIRIFLGKKLNLLNSNSEISVTKIKTVVKNTEIILNVSDKHHKKARELIIKVQNDKYTVYFSNIKKIIIKKNRNVFKEIFIGTKTLDKQILYFLTSSKKLNINSLNNQEALFEDLTLLRNKVGKK